MKYITPECNRCGSEKMKPIRAMKNVEKWVCTKCKKYSYYPLGSTGRRVPERKGTPPRRRLRGEGGAPRKGFVAWNHQNKGDAFINALKEQGFTQLSTSPVYRNVPMVLTDSDILGRAFHLQKFYENGSRVFFVTPHTARPNIVNDIVDGFRHTTAQFVAASGHVDIMRAYGYKKPLHVTGWPFCPIRRFRPAPERDKFRVLFGPIHPRCSEIDKIVNRGAFSRLVKLAKKDAITLTVRFIKSLPDSGIKEMVKHPNITYDPGWMNQAYDAIDNHDLTVGHQTLAYLAVARGKPTLMMAERELKTHIEPRKKPMMFAKNWEKYVDMLAYPLDIMETDDVYGLIENACKSDDEIVEWRSRMIGQPFRSKKFVEIAKSYL